MARHCSLGVLLLLLLPCTARAQAASGALEVVVEGGRSGVLLRLESPGLRRQALTDAHGRAVFAHLRPGRYSLMATGAIERTVEVRPATTHRLLLPPNASRETEALASPSFDPPTASGRVFASQQLRAIPRPSDLWSVLAEVPGVVLDRVNVGGSETALQSLAASRGDGGAGATWTVDGFDVTDPAALGATSILLGLDPLEAVQARTSALDVRVRTPGVQAALFLREPGSSRLSGRAHLRGAFDRLQSDNLPETLSLRPFFRNRTERLLEAGAEAGGPMAGGRAWLWASASRAELRQRTFTEHDERLALTSFAVKARGRVAGTNASLLVLRNEKTHHDRDTGFSASPESRWRQSGPTHLVGAEVQRSLKEVSLLARVSYLDAGFRLDPQGGRTASAFEDLEGVFRNSYYTLATQRPRLQMGVEGSTARQAAGFHHHLLAGAGYRRSVVSTELAWPGNKVLGLERQSVFFRTFRLTGFALPTRDQSARSVQDQAELYLQDEARRGRFTVHLGLRIDRSRGRNLASSVEANPVFPALLPAVSYAGAPANIRWLDVLPRAGVTWDASGEGRTVLHAGYAAYAAALSAGDVIFDNPLGREPASLTFYWRDLDGDHLVDEGELDLLRGRIGASGVDPEAPGAAASPHRVDAGLAAPRTHELRGALQRSFGRWLQVSLDTTWRRTSDLRWAPLRGLTLGDYAIRGAVQGQLFGRPYSVGFFAPASESRIVSGNGRLLRNRPRYRQDAFTIALSARARWRQRLEAETWAAFTDWREFFADRERAVQDPTPLDTEPLIDAGAVTARPGGLGRADVFVSARWMAGFSVRASLPAGLAAAVRAQAREGFPIPYYQVASTGDPTGGAKNVLVSSRLDEHRLPALLLIDARVDRAFPLGRGQLTLGLDAFNLLDASTTLQVARDVELPAFDRPREIVRPRIFSLGVEYRF